MMHSGLNLLFERGAGGILCFWVTDDATNDQWTAGMRTGHVQGAQIAHNITGCPSRG